MLHEKSFTGSVTWGKSWDNIKDAIPLFTNCFAFYPPLFFARLRLSNGNSIPEACF